MAVLGVLGAIMLAAAPVPPGRCPGDAQLAAAPGAVGVRTVGGVRIGAISYPASAPLGDHEIALTFDDGPDDDHTRQVLEILRRHCIRATFFLVGQEVRSDPVTVQAIAAAGHTIGAHSMTHPDSLAALPADAARAEIEDSFAEIRQALAAAPAEDRARVTRFFRYPSLIDSAALNGWLAERNIAVISADLDADDWDDLGSEDILARAIVRTEARGRGVLLLHDFNPRMIAILDRLIVALERRGYRFVQLTQAD